MSLVIIFSEQGQGGVGYAFVPEAPLSHLDNWFPSEKISSKFGKNIVIMFNQNTVPVGK